MMNTYDVVFVAKGTVQIRVSAEDEEAAEKRARELADRDFEFGFDVDDVEIADRLYIREVNP